MAYSQQIQYIDYINEGVKVNNAGFVKIVQDGEIQKIDLKILGVRQNIKGQYDVWIIPEKDKNLSVLLGKINIENTRGAFWTLKKAGTKAQDAQIKIYLGGSEVLQGKIDYFLMEQQEDTKEPLYWKEQEIGQLIIDDKRGTIERKVKKEEKLSEPLQEIAKTGQGEITEKTGKTGQGETTEKTGKTGQGEITEKTGKTGQGEIMEKEEMVPREESDIMEINKWQQLCKIYPHKNPFSDERDYLVLQPADFVILSEESYQMAENSFLLHGYNNYGYLILWRNLLKGEVRYYVGVPGIFHEKECQAAVFFGFESFEGKKEPPAEGDFGFYMKRVEI